jgi:hypothetical protein
MEHMAHSAGASWLQIEAIFGLVELPFLFTSVVFGFLTARALRGGVFGRGMALIASGSLVMAIGHLHMQIDQLFGFNLFSWLLGPEVGAVAWFLALVTTWLLTGFGFYQMYAAGRGRSRSRSHAGQTSPAMSMRSA